MAECCSFPPGADANARVLILGSMPGAESLRMRQYYAFRHNVFWRIAGEVFSFSPELAYPERLELLRRNGVALWDVLAECERDGSLDQAIRNPRPNDIPGLLRRMPRVEKICCNGGASGRYLRRFFPDAFRMTEILPSTSPAAARWSYSEKLARWREALNFLFDKRRFPEISSGRG